MSISVRLSKLLFLVREMEVALFLTKNATDDFTSRILARHILIRAENFIAHARGLRKPLIQLGHNVTKFHEDKETYANYFDEYFSIPRDKLGAHVQDLDFGKRIELWNDIELSKIEFFVEASREIYINRLGPLNLSDYTPYSAPEELENPDLLDALNALKLTADNETPHIRVGVDPLAMARPNTSAMLNFTPVHSRAGQISLINKWVESELTLLNAVSPFIWSARILKEMLVTDVVSLSDSLITRSVPAGAPQEMDGLDALIVGEDNALKIITDFISSYKFNEKLSCLRAVRNSIGAHLDGDNSFTLADIQASLDALKLEEITDFYERLKQVFRQVCRSVIYLMTYLSNDAVIHGVIAAAENSSATPFDGGSVDTPKLALEREDFTPGTYQRKLNDFISGTDLVKGNARHYFFQALMHSGVIEHVIETESLSGGSVVRNHSHEYRSAHEWLLQAILNCKVATDVQKIMELLLTCRGGAPYMLSEIVLRYARKNPIGFGSEFFCHLLGELASWPHKSVHEYVYGLISTEKRNLSVAISANNCALRIYVRSEGLLRANNKNRALVALSDEISPLLDKHTGDSLLLVKLCLISQFSRSDTSTYLRYFENDVGLLKASIKNDISAFFTPADFKIHEETLDPLMDSFDFVGVALLLSEAVKDKNKAAFRDNLIKAVINGDILVAAHDQALRHLACCYLKRELFDLALNVAKDISNRNPQRVATQIFVVQVLAETPGASADAIAELDKVISKYTLSQEEQEWCDEIRAYIQSKAVLSSYSPA